MISLKRTAALLSLLDSILAVYTYFPGFAGSYDNIFLFLGIVFLLVSMICLYGLFYAFYGSVVLSAALLILSIAVGGYSSYFIVLDILSAASLSASVIVVRRSTKLPEQVHPLNLPVFG